MALENVGSVLGSIIGSEYASLVTQNEYVQFGLILVSFLVLGAVFHFVIKGVFRGLASKTKTDLDDKIFEIISMPIFLMINLFGIYLALNSLSMLEAYTKTITDVFFVIYVLVAVTVVSKIVGLLVDRLMTGHSGDVKTPGIFIKVIRIVFFLVAFLIILRYFGVDVTAAAAALGVGGIAIGLALQGTLTNFFSGVHIITDRPIKPGDYIEIEGTEIRGFVEDIGWRSTRIRTWQDNTVIIPNTKLAESVIVNSEMPQKETTVKVLCGVGYGSDLENVESVVLDVARGVQKGVKGATRDFEPVVRFTEFGDSNINFFVTLRVAEFPEKFYVRHEFIKALKARFDKDGIEISFPVRKVYQMK